MQGPFYARYYIRVTMSNTYRIEKWHWLPRNSIMNDLEMLVYSSACHGMSRQIGHCQQLTLLYASFENVPPGKKFLVKSSSRLESIVPVQDFRRRRTEEQLIVFLQKAVTACTIQCKKFLQKIRNRRRRKPKVALTSTFI